MIPVGVANHRHVDLFRASGMDFETRRHHADDGERLFIDSDDLAQGVCALGEMPLPEKVAQKHHPVSTGLLLIGTECSPELWVHAKGIKECGGSLHRGNAFGLLLRGENCASGCKGGYALEAFALRLPILKV